ncbi:MAG: hypothetical protein ACK5WZ_14710, partial [Pseudobdellovibrionaceae bacterium]
MQPNKDQHKEQRLDTKALGERTKALDLAVSTIEKQFGKGSIMRLGAGETLNKDIEVISTGALSLD